MACKEVKTEIDSVKYMTVQFPTRIGLALKTRLLRLMSPSIKDAFSKIENNAISINIAAIFEGLEDDSASKLMLDLLAYTYREGKKIDEESFNLDFAGDYVHLYKVILWIIEANGFFGKGSIGDMLKGLTQSQVISPILPKN